MALFCTSNVRYKFLFTFKWSACEVALVGVANNLNEKLLKKILMINDCHYVSVDTECLMKRKYLIVMDN